MRRTHITCKPGGEPREVESGAAYAPDSRPGSRTWSLALATRVRGKPRLRMQNGTWWCGPGIVDGVGSTPQEA
jgi:hypothetical protein